MKKLLIVVLLGFYFLLAFSQDTYNYKGKTYTVQTGSKGGKYIMVDNYKHYISSESKITVTGNKAIYKNVEYTVFVGPKGGKYILLTGGTKKYIN